MKKTALFLFAASLSLGAIAAPEAYVIDGSHTYPASNTATSVTRPN